MHSLSTLLSYYSQSWLANEMLRCSEHKEVVGSFGGKGFAKRPDVLLYPNDILELVRSGVTSFHSSEELWNNPLHLTLEGGGANEGNRRGWDMILDIDCVELEWSKIAAHLLIEALHYHGVKNIGVKFSGNHGFHIGVPFESFPTMLDSKETRLLFPIAPRKIAAYLGSMIKNYLASQLLLRNSVSDIAARVGKSQNELLDRGKFNPYAVLVIDTVLISPRHLCRLVYSLNEKSGLASVPIDPESILIFQKDQGKLENIRPSQFKFLDRQSSTANEAERLLIEAFDYHAKVSGSTDERDTPSTVRYEELTEAVPEDFFPPCTRLILGGITDGKKRSVFILLNFLRNLGWSYDQIEERLKVWNSHNTPSLREQSLVGQIRYHKQHQKKILPPNCANAMYYREIGVCQPDNLCSKISNPAQYAKRKAYYHLQKTGNDNGAKKETLTDEQREMRKRYREKLKTS